MLGPGSPAPGSPAARLGADVDHPPGPLVALLVAVPPHATSFAGLPGAQVSRHPSVCQARRRCATAGCRSRSSRPRSWATTPSPTTCRRARWPTAGCPTSASTSTSTTWCSATATTSATRCCGRRWPPAATGSRPTTCSSPPGRPPPCSAWPPPLLDRGDHAVVVRTNYATNLETPRAIGADLDIVDLSYDDGWALDLDEVADKVAPRHHPADQRHLPPQPDRHDARPSTTCKRLVGLAERAEAVLLVDETYRDLTHTGERIPLAATLSPNVVSVSSMSQGLRAARASASAGRSPPTPSWARPCWPPRSRW